MNLLRMATEGAKRGLRGVIKKSPIILAGAAIAGVAGVAIIAVKKGPEIKEVFKTKKEDLEDVTKQLEKKEITEEQAKALRREIRIKFAKDLAISSAPIVITAVITITCILGLNSVHAKRQAALAAIASLADSQSEIFVDKAKELIGEDKVKAIEEAIFKDELDKNAKKDVWGPNQNPDRMVLPNGHYPIKLGTQNYYITGTAETADNIELWISNMIFRCSSVSVADFHDHVDAPHTDDSESFGWSEGDNVHVILVPGETPLGHLCYKMRIKPAPHPI